MTGGDEGADRREPVTGRTIFWWSVAGALGALTVAVTAFALYTVRDLLVRVAVAAFIAISLDPPVRWLVRHKVRRPVAVAIILLTLLGLVGLLAWLAMPPLVDQATKLTSDFPGYLDNLRARSPRLAALEARFDLKPKVDEFAATFLDRAQREALAVSRRFLGALISALLITVLTIYFMLDLSRLRASIVRLFPVRHRPQVSHGVNVVVEKVGSYMIGNLVISAIAGITSYVAMLVLGVPFALPLAAFVAITDLIPLVGATLGAVVCTIVAVATTDIWPGAILLAAFFILYQQLENYLIAPYVMRNSVDMPSLAVLLAALLGASVLGLVGALMAIPMAAAVKVLVTPAIRARDAEYNGFDDHDEGGGDGGGGDGDGGDGGGAPARAG